MTYMADEPSDKIDEITDEARRKINETDLEFEKKLQDLETRASRAKEKRENVEKKISRERADSASSARGLGVGLTVAYAIIGTPLVGAGAGWLIDRSVGGTLWMGILTVSGAFIGVGCAVYILNKLEQE